MSSRVKCPEFLKNLGDCIKPVLRVKCTFLNMIKVSTICYQIFLGMFYVYVCVYVVFCFCV
jgi:hypothetical protein